MANSRRRFPVGKNTAIFLILLAKNKANTNATLLSESEFGLWFRHKCVRYFNKNSQMDEIAALISQVDDLLIGWRASASVMDYKKIHKNLIQGIHIHCQQIGSQLGVIFLAACRRCKMAKMR